MFKVLILTATIPYNRIIPNTMLMASTPMNDIAGLDFEINN